MNQQHEELEVFISSRKSSCDECGENLGSKAWITLIRDKGALCLACADLDHPSFVKYSGRVGRSASAKSLADEAVRLAVIAHVRHAETDYDTLLAKGYERQEARAEVRETVGLILARWEGEE